MGRRKRSATPGQGTPVRIQLPRDALSRIDLGHSFAEYDKILQQRGVFVNTPQVESAATKGVGCFFVGRRGTGKTATSFYLQNHSKHSVTLSPQVFELQTISLDVSKYKDTRQRPFRALVYTFRRAMLSEVIRYWLDKKLIQWKHIPQSLFSDREVIEGADFDLRTLKFLQEYQAAQDDDEAWLRLTRHSSKDNKHDFNDIPIQPDYATTLIFDRIDESWDGTEQAVIILMSLMHACVELITACPAVRPRVFLRENIFERVREADNEFSRLETFVVSMDWSQELLLELIERRLNLPFNVKLPLRGPTWDYFFESTEGQSSRSTVFEYCQERPRDVLTYCKFAIDSAQNRKHEKVTIEDLQAARQRFSDSRLKDLGDEYAENYPQIQLVLSRFFGLGTQFTIGGIEAFIKKLLIDEDVKRHCAKWIFSESTTDRFIHLLYNIGFLGLRDNQNTHYRSVGAKSSTPPALSAGTHAVIHPSYHHALSLREVVIRDLDEAMPLRESGMLLELPESIDLNDYRDRLQKVSEDLRTLPTGLDPSTQFEDLVGEVIRLCFFRALSNVEPQSRTIDGKIRRDWVASNRAHAGFWEIVRQRYEATQVIWECKNYEELTASDFQQFSYYMTGTMGRFVVCSFRGVVRKSDLEHVRRIADKDGGLVLLLTDKDLQVFIRQAIAGKFKEDHIQDIYDGHLRAIS